MQQSKAIIVGSVIVGAWTVALLGYTVLRDRAEAEAAQHERQQQFVDEQKAEQNRLKEKLHDLRLAAYERQFGRAERLRLEAFEYGVRAEGVEVACVKQSLSPKRCETLEENRQALFADGESTFSRPLAQ
jgi:hypothetical protein